MNILAFSSLWPNREQPNFGIFVKNRVSAMSRLDGVNVRVVAPVPYFPRFFDSPIIVKYSPEHWRRTLRIPIVETIAGLDTFHPRHLVTPKIGMTFYGGWMARGAFDLVRQLHQQQPIDLIDAHYVYPDGYAAVKIGGRLKIPVVVSARGTDINLFSRMPLIRPLVVRTLNRAEGIIAVSGALKERIVELGIEDKKVAVIRNGIDRSIFFLKDRAEARRRLGLETRGRIIVTAGALVPLKGIDLLIDAISLLKNTDAKLYVIGSGPERESLRRRVTKKHLNNRVFFAGMLPQSDLTEWLSAGDVFCLASSREGCPNVVIEAMACGTPVVASDVGGVRELIDATKTGKLVESKSAEAFATEIDAALDADWDHNEIARIGGDRSWDDVAQDVLNYYSEIR